MELKRWPVIQPLFPHLVAAVEAGHGKVVLEFFLKKIYESDSEINAVVESFLPGSTRATPCKAGPFEGLPLLVKDNLDVEGFRTVCGSSLFINNPVAVKDSKFVAVLRELGAIPVGKTNVPPFSMDVQTFNDVYGTTNNPYNLQWTAGGSSGGSAAAVAMAMAPFAVGNDLNGSLRLPASFCGVCSFHASRGRMAIQQEDVFPPSHPSVGADVLGFILTEGVFTTNVSDLEYCMRPLLQRSISEAQDSDIRKPLLGQHIFLGVVTSFSSMLLDHRIEEAMKKIPLWIQESSSITGRRNLIAKMAENFFLDAKRTHKATRIRGDAVATRKYSSTGLEEARSIQEILGDAVATRKYNLTNLEEARSIQATSSAAVEAFFESTGFSALIMPVLPPKHNPEHNPVLVNGIKLPYFMGMCSFVEPVKISGNPVVTMPLCLIDGRPCGIQVVGRRGCDEELLTICVELEHHLASPETCGTHPLKFPTQADFSF